MAALSTTGIRPDPLLAHNFLISLVDTTSTFDLLKTAAVSAVADVVLGGFSECSGLETTLAVHDYEEGGNNGTVLRFPTRVKWANLALKRGVGANTALWDWHYGFVTGKGERRDGVITLLDGQHVPNAVWYFKRGLPVKYSGPVLNAISNAVAIESIEIAHEGIFQVPGVGIGGALLGAALGGGLGGVGSAITGAAGLV